MNVFAIILLVLLGVFIVFEAIVLTRDIIIKIKEKKNPKKQEENFDTESQVID